MPVISEDHFFASVNDLTVEPNAETAIPALSIHLAIQLPRSNNAEHLRTSLYATIKMHLAMLEACGIISVSVVQSRLLVCLYELGHGFLNAAACTIVLCICIGCALGLQQICIPQSLP